MSTIYGVTPAGFVSKQQSTIQSEIQASLQAALGQSINLLPESVFGNIVGIFSEREALVWQMGEAVYDSQFPSGAEGTSVDNILALNNLRRLGATPSKTSPTINGIPGLVLYGTPATVVPAGSLISVLGAPASQFALDADVVIGSAVNAVQSIIFSNVPDTGAFSLSIVDPAGNELTTGSMTFATLAGQSKITFSAVPVTGSFKLVLTRGGGAQTSALIPFTANAAAVQTAIQALPGYGFATVTGDFTVGFTVTWGSIPHPFITFSTNTLGVTPAANNSIQSQVNNLYDAAEANYPYTDVDVTGSFTIGLTITFGIHSVVGSNPSSGDQAQNNFQQAANTLQNGATVTNISITTTVVGLQNQGLGSATAVANGPTYAPAGTLTVIDSSVSGWASVNNPLDAVLGSNIETDTEALTRRLRLLAAQANGPLQSIVEKVLQVSGVTAALGFENTNIAVDGSGRPGKSFEIVVQGGVNVDIAQAIYNAKPAGILAYGSTSVTIDDAFGNPTVISFSRPTEVPVYVVIALTTDLTDPSPNFVPGSIPVIQQDIVNIGNRVPIGGLIVGFGTDGLIGAFNSVPGIKSYTLFFGLSPNPLVNTNIQLTAEQLAVFETFNVIVSYT